jgi:hypothetical protein
MTVFIAGSISIDRITKAAAQRLDSIIDNGYAVVVGDAGGVDKAVERYLLDRHYNQVTVYCINQPRNNLGDWPVETVARTQSRPRRSDFAKKDLTMAEAADVGFMIWDGKSSGTLNNVLNLLSLGKHSLVYVHMEDQFLWIKDAQDSVMLAERIPADVREDVEKKVDLSRPIEALKSDAAYEIQSARQSVRKSQLDLFGLGGGAPYG